MIVRWFGAKVFKLTSPTGDVQHATTFSRIDWDNWVYTDEDGADYAIKFPRDRYPYPRSYAYNEAAPPYTVALVRMECPDDLVVRAGDRTVELDTPAKWRALAAQYPALVARFTDQPTG